MRFIEWGEGGTEGRREVGWNERKEVGQMEERRDDMQQMNQVGFQPCRCSKASALLVLQTLPGEQTGCPRDSFPGH